MADPESNGSDENGSEKLYSPKPGELQLTLRAVIAGCVLGCLAGGMNIYMGLKIGWTVGGSLMTAILSVALFTLLKPKKKYTVLETNISQTTGSAAGSMASAAGLVAPIPAMTMIGYPLASAMPLFPKAAFEATPGAPAGGFDPSLLVAALEQQSANSIPLWTLFVWSLAIAYLGVFFAVPLRRQFVLIEKLRFPTGTATAHTITSMFATAGEAVAKARVLVATAIVAGVFTVGIQFWPLLEVGGVIPTDWGWHSLDHVPLTKWLRIDSLFVWAGISSLAAWTFKIYLGPMLWGAGFLMGMRVTASMLAGAIVGWGVLGPLAHSQGWAPGEVMSLKDGPRGWILWPGVAIMVADALTSLALSWKTIVRTFRFSKKDAEDLGSNPDEIPTKWWIGGLAAATAATTVLANIAFGIPPHLSIIAVALSSILAAIAVRSVGETDIGPIGAMGKVTQLVFGGLSPGNMSTNLMAAAVAGAGASQAGDMMQDLKTGHLLGASPRRQFLAQLCGIGAGVLVVVPIFFLLNGAYEIGADKLPAPAAHAWAAVARFMAVGLSALPPNTGWAALGGLILGILLPVLRKLFPKAAPYLPSGLAFGIAFIVHAFYSITMFAGAVAFLLWKAKDKKQANRFVFAVASGLIAGEGLIGILNAVLTLLGIPNVQGLGGVLSAALGVLG